MARLSVILGNSVAAACLAAVGVSGAVHAQSEQKAAAQATLEIRAGQASDFSRLEFHWAGVARATQRRDGQKLTLRFSRNATPDLANLKTFPPRYLAGIASRTVGGVLEVELTLAEGADAKVGQVDGSTYVNLFKAQEPVEPSPEEQAAPVASAGVVKVTSQTRGDETALSFAWKDTVAAAVFRRGDTVWVVFDTPATMDTSSIPRVTPQMSGVQTITGPNYTAVRIQSPVSAPVSATGSGSLWTVTLGDDGPPLAGVTIGRDDESDTPGLTAAVAGATRAIWVEDPVVGERFAVITALGPAKGLDVPRKYADLEFLPSAQGLAIQPRAQDLTLSVEGDLVRVNRPAGLALSSGAAATDATAIADGPQPAALPCLIDFSDWSKLGEDGFFSRYDDLRNAAGDEAAGDEASAGKAPQVQARMALARFLVGSELPHEAIGVLNLLGRTHEQMLSDPEFRGLRGAAKVMAGRYEEASGDFASSVLANDPSAALWRGYIAAESGRWEDARAAFEDGYNVLGQVEGDWRAKFTRADAEAALNLGDLDTARSQLVSAVAVNPSANEIWATNLMTARLFEQQGAKAAALRVYDSVARAPRGDIAAAAGLRATKLRLEQGAITPMQAADTFDSLRYQWRGDETELDTIQALGQLYLGLGRYREALMVLGSARSTNLDLPQMATLNQETADTFRELFLMGKADGLEPIQAVALFYDFNYLTPVGAEGDQMVRNLARRLVDVDLLNTAAELLDYQVNNRLEGVAKAQVATDLAVIQLMNRKPEEALNAINESRTTILPTALNQRRRVLSARALMGLGRFDAALEMVETERTPEADDVRSEIAWRQRDWAKSGAAYEKRLGERYKTEGPLTADEEARVLRAAVAFSLANDPVGLARMRDRYSRYVDTARSPDSLRVAFAGVDQARLTTADFNRVMQDGDTFISWVNQMKRSFRTQTASAAPTATPAATAAAAPAPRAPTAAPTPAAARAATPAPKAG